MNEHQLTVPEASLSRTRIGRRWFFSVITGLLAMTSFQADDAHAQTIKDESKVPKYTLPDPLVTEAGEPVADAKTWQTKRRGEILRLFEQNVYGKSPTRPQGIVAEVTSSDAEALGGLATRQEITLYLGPGKTGPKMNLLVYKPNNTKGPHPTFLTLNFEGNHTVHDDPGITVASCWVPANDAGGVVDHRASEKSRGMKKSRWSVERVVRRGYAFVTACYCDIDADFHDGFKNGPHPLFYREGQTAPAKDEWGSIGAWAWGLSRAMDYFETNDDFDEKRVAILGHSRLGKTALWAGAQDERIALVISNNSGCGGATLSRRRFGETLTDINRNFPHWFCGQFKHFNVRENTLPIDQHQLIALIAPRPVYIASASKDGWADPRGEFLSARAADPVYRLLTKRGIDTKQMPSTNQSVGDLIGYHVRDGFHDVTDFDWQQYLDFADRHFGR